MLTTLRRWNPMLVKNQFSILPNAAFYKHRSETLQYREDLLNTPSENHFICNVQNEQNIDQFGGYLCRKRSMLASNKLAFEKSAFNQLDHFAFCIQKERLDAKLDKTCAEQKFLREKSNSALQLHRQCGTRVSSQKKLNFARTQEASKQTNITSRAALISCRRKASFWRCMHLHRRTINWDVHSESHLSWGTHYQNLSRPDPIMASERYIALGSNTYITYQGSALREIEKGGTNLWLLTVSWLLHR